MSRLTRDGTAEPVSRDQILRHARGQGNIHFPCSADHEQDWQPHPVDPHCAICDDHTYIHTVLSSASKLYCCRQLFCLESRALAEAMFQLLFAACVVIPLSFGLRSHGKPVSESTAVRRKLRQ